MEIPKDRLEQLQWILDKLISLLDANSVGKFRRMDFEYVIGKVGWMISRLETEGGEKKVSEKDVGEITSGTFEGIMVKWADNLERQGELKAKRELYDWIKGIFHHHAKGTERDELRHKMGEVRKEIAALEGSLNNKDCKDDAKGEENGGVETLPDGMKYHHWPKEEKECRSTANACEHNFRWYDDITVYQCCKCKMYFKDYVLSELGMLRKGLCSANGSLNLYYERWNAIESRLKALEEKDKP